MGSWKMCLVSKWAMDRGKHDKKSLNETITRIHTVDARNAAPVDMVNIPLFTGF